jgi:ribosomal protein S18 acetylase RimI-like enzyme
MMLGFQEEGHPLPPQIVIRSYSAKDDHEVIPSIYERSFGEPPWPHDWEQFDEFDAKGMFVAEDVQREQVVGYVISFKRRDHGYLSVLAVLPEYHRRGIGSALIKTAIDYLRGKGLEVIMVDAPADSPAAVAVYRKAGFYIEKTFEDDYEIPEAEQSRGADAEDRAAHSSDAI